jgi:hypothetical protein
MAKHHQKKEISEAIEYALNNGFVIVPAGRSSHIAFKLYCPVSSREGCKIPVYSTPRVPRDHADFIRKQVDNCLVIHPRPPAEETP